MLRLYDQTTFSDRDAGTYGDCCRACVATLLQIDPQTLPHPIGPDGQWHMPFHKALRDIGWSIRSIDYDPQLAPDCTIRDQNWGGFQVPQLVMAAGRSPRGKWLHAVIWDRLADRMVHDPHPSRAGLVSIEARIAAADALAEACRDLGGMNVREIVAALAAYENSKEQG